MKKRDNFCQIKTIKILEKWQKTTKKATKKRQIVVFSFWSCSFLSPPKKATKLRQKRQFVVFSFCRRPSHVKSCLNQNFLKIWALLRFFKTFLTIFVVILSFLIVINSIQCLKILIKSLKCPQMSLKVNDLLYFQKFADIWGYFLTFLVIRSYVWHFRTSLLIF